MRPARRGNRRAVPPARLSFIVRSMAAIGNLYLAGDPPNGEDLAKSALACSLKVPLSSDLSWRFEDEGWIVAGLRGFRFIVARCRHQLDSAAAQAQGLSAIQKALDLVSAHRNQTAMLSAPGDNFITVCEVESQVLMTINAVFNLSVGVSASVEVRDKDGNVKPQPTSPLPLWHRSLRYYRLSQSASDTYEAYRNLYLAFEALAEEFHPRAEGEREGEWVRRCFSELHREHNLAAFAPEGHPAPNEYLHGTLYEFVRCNLFHSRTASTILPFYEVSAPAIEAAYQQLLRIWRHLAHAVLGVSAGGGVVTHQGYKHWMNGVFNNGASVIVSDDENGVERSDTSINPSGGRVHTVECCDYISEVEPGTVGVRASDSRAAEMPRINRLGLMVGDVLHAVSDWQPGITLGGVTNLQVNLYQRLIQGNQPKVHFEK